jgi:16S rRNA (cytosine1402-N4)-methyltransferase
LGGAGHAELIVKRLGSTGRLIGLDQDPDALAEAQKRLKNYSPQVTLVRNNFRFLEQVLDSLGLDKADGILLDLGVSSHQLDTAERGFSLSLSEANRYARLDMRMDPSQELSAYEVVNHYPEERLREILFTLGEEPYSRSIARRIALERQKKPISSPHDLLEIIKSATPPKYRFSRRQGHYASKVFRALRMEVNQELPALQEVLSQAVNRLKQGGRLVVLTFHSLEDRMVKRFFRQESQGDGPKLKILTKKPILPQKQEISSNPRANSAKLRAAEKII